MIKQPCKIFFHTRYVSLFMGNLSSSNEAQTSIPMAPAPDTCKKPHAVLVPFPAQGHLNPFLKLAKLLHHRGFHITFVNTEFNHNRLLKSKGSTFLENLPDFCFETFPDGLPPSDADATQSVPALCDSMRRNSLVPFRELLAKLNNSWVVPPVTCVVSDGVMTFTLQAAHEMNVRCVLFWTFAACGFLSFKLCADLIDRGITPFKGIVVICIMWMEGLEMNVRCVLFWTFAACGFLSFKLCADLIDRGITPFKDSSYLTDGSLEALVDWVPGLENFRYKHILTFIQTTDPNNVLLAYVKEEIEAISKASAVILHTFDALERRLLDILSPNLPPIYTIGPLQPLVDQISVKNAVSSMDFSLWKAEDECFEWLNSKEQNSVIYVNFGSVEVLTPCEIQELALGLAESKKNFLWILRPDLIKGNSGILPPDFSAETKDRGLIVRWCQQEKVLNHPSVGGFLTHCGWNSIIEGITAGVPFLCLPQTTDQPANCRSVCIEWGIGLEISKNFKKDEVGMLVKELLDGENGREMKKRAMEWKKQVAAATASPQGSSFQNLETLVKEMLLK
ncbi:7-deoxyloganetin glucosyltransferase-like [Sesamum indicum]|uniref:7-deoxyloganetin glucosyltransferase-like n=1 Tax=Sesamum indicum TaxID=4182 RepID=A0A8M8V1B9_SESIN|nr:7-deoxyloganetin glucosyltransferase-like [Sesamum indicum]